jgi:cell division protein FtsL
MNPLLIVITVLLIVNIGLLFYAAHLLETRRELLEDLEDLWEKFNNYEK